VPPSTTLPIVPLDTATLKDVPLFSSLGDKELQKIVSLFHTRQFQAGHAIAKEGDQGVGFFIIESGTATVTAHGETRATLGPGSHFGEIAALDPGPRIATVTADTDVDTFMLEAWNLRQLVHEDPALAAGIIDGLVQIVRRLEERLAAD
jgi:CRP/FNR family transcriptional regulator, cyclic AMP receptor protein